MRLSRTETTLIKTLLALRITLYFFILPSLRTIWYRSPLPPFEQGTDGFFGQLWKTIYVFDSAQLGFVGSTKQEFGGYFSEQNHAFYPMYPWMNYFVATLFGDYH